ISLRTDLVSSLRIDLDGSSRTDLVSSLRTDLDGSSRPDLVSSLRTDLDGSSGTDLVCSLRTDLDGSSGTDLVSSLRTDLDGSSGTDLVCSLRTDLDGSFGTDLDSSLRTDLDGSLGTDLVCSQTTDLVRTLGFLMSKFTSLLYMNDFVVQMSLPIIVKTMATTIEQQVTLDEALVPRTKRLRIGRSNFRLPSDIQSKESTLQVVYDVLRGCPFFKAFLVTADVPEIYMVPGQSFDELPFEEEILDFLRFLGHSAQIKTLTDVNVNKLFQPWRSFAAVVSRHQNTQQYGVILPIELTTEDIRNTKAYKGYYACATGEAAPKLKAGAKRKKSDSDTSITPPTATLTPITIVAAAPRLTAAAKGKQPAKAKSSYDPLEVERTEAEQLKIVLRRSRQETHISQHGGSSTDKGSGSKPGVPDVPSDDSEEGISWNSSDDEDVDAQDKDRNDDEGDQNDESDDGKEDDDDDQDDVKRDDDNDGNDDEEEIAKIDEPEDTKSGGCDEEETKSDEESAEAETKEEEEESFDPIPSTPEDSKDDGNGEEDQGLRVSEEQRLIEEEEADELYRDKESSLVSSFVTSMLNSISDAGVESMFTTASSSVAPLPTPIPTMTPSIITTITTASHSSIPPTPIPKMELKKILIEKMEGNKSIQRLEEQRNLYKALVDAYEADKTILESYEDIAILKRRRGDDDNQEGPSAGSD
nr:hypothetical protein [Tanacetum cinerariifolium]